MSMDAVAMPVSVPVSADAAVAPEVQTARLTTLAALESALDHGLLDAWSQLVAADPLCSVYQAPGWCVAWYRSYQDAYDPRLLIISSAQGVVGIVPMAVEKGSGALVFASDAMADYRDIVARPGYRAAVIEALIADYVAGGFPGPLRIGWLDPASDTPALAAAASARLGLRHSVRHQPCYRWFPVEGENLQKKFSRVKTHLNYFKRQGEVSFDVIDRPEEWTAFADEFYRQHSLRQLQASREVSFDDPRKQQLYASLFAAGDVRMHVTACRVNGRMIAGHIGLVWRDVLLLGAPSISLEDENRSPAVILMTWIIQNAASLGLAGFDLTIGESEFKRRLANRCVELSMVEIYGRARHYYGDRVRTEALRLAKDAVERMLGPGAWQTRVKPAAEALAYKRRRLAEIGARAALGKALRYAPGRDPVELTLSLTAAAWQSSAAAASVATASEVRANQVEDLLLCADQAPSTLSALTGCARSYARNRGAGHTLHTLVSRDTLLAWCYSRGPEQANAAAVIYDVSAPRRDAPGEAVAALITQVVRDRFAHGAGRVDVVLAEDAAAERQALGALGFHLAETA